MENLRAFELLLLSEMRGKEMVDKALTVMSASRAEMMRAKETMEKHGFFNVPPPPIEQYLRILGDSYPIERETIKCPDENCSPIGFQLPLWPDFYYVVFNYQSLNSAYMAGFTRIKKTETPKLERIEDLAPWRFTEEEVSSRFTKMREINNWFPVRDFEYEAIAHASERKTKYVLRFDHNLLQSIEVNDS